MWTQVLFGHAAVAWHRANYLSVRTDRWGYLQIELDLHCTRSVIEWTEKQFWCAVPDMELR